MSKWHISENTKFIVCLALPSNLTHPRRELGIRITLCFRRKVEYPETIHAHPAADIILLHSVFLSTVGPFI